MYCYLNGTISYLSEWFMQYINLKGEANIIDRGFITSASSPETGTRETLRGWFSDAMEFPLRTAVFR